MFKDTIEFSDYVELITSELILQYCGLFHEHTICMCHICDVVGML